MEVCKGEVGNNAEEGGKKTCPTTSGNTGVIQVWRQATPNPKVQPWVEHNKHTLHYCKSGLQFNKTYT